MRRLSSAASSRLVQPKRTAASAYPSPTIRQEGGAAGGLLRRTTLSLQSNSSWSRWSSAPPAAAAAATNAQTTFSKDSSTSSGSSAGAVEVEVLHVDEIISGDAFDDDATDPSGAGPPPGAKGNSSTSPPQQPPQAHVPLLRLDPFARSKALNFIKKYAAAGDASSSAGGGPSPFHVEKIHFDQQLQQQPARGGGGSGGGSRDAQDDGAAQDTEYRVTLRLPLPSEYGKRVAEGIAANLKDAEVAAAMHAEKIIDALGFPLYSLQTSQKRHAEAARAAGRWAPFPGDAQKPVGTPSPAPLSYGQLRSVAGGGGHRARSQQQQQQQARSDVFDVDFDQVTLAPGFASSRNLADTSYQLHQKSSSVPTYALGPAPFVVDDSCVFRVRGFLRAYGQKVLQCSRVLSRSAPTLGADDGGQRYRPATPSTRRQAGGGDDKDDATKEFLCQITLPLDDRFGPRVATGKAVGSKRLAYVLACMHAELMIDTLGLKLYPVDRDMQQQHHADVAAAGRWCAAPGETTLFVDRPSPKPFALATAACGDASGNARAEELLAAQRHAVAGHRTLVNIQFVDAKAEEDATAYLGKGRGGQSFVVVRLGTKQQHHHHHSGGGGASSPKGSTYRATCIVPLSNRILPAPSNGAEPSPTTATTTLEEKQQMSQTLGVVQLAENGMTAFVAIGVAPTAADAVAVCAMHALQCLGALHVPVYGDDAAKQQLCHDRIAAAGGLAVDPRSPRSPAAPAALPLPMKLLDATAVGRIWAGQDYAAVAGGSAASSAVSFRSMQDAVLKGREEHSALVWDLEDDDDHGLVPEASQRRILVAPTAAPGRNYIHTLFSPRSPCVRALDRLFDYLERNGTDPEAAVAVADLPPARCDDGQARSLFTASVPLPRRHSGGGQSEEEGRLLAVGESFLSAEDAKVMCAMHAELLLDASGLELYDHQGLQRQHAETAWGLGRHCPAAWRNHSDARSTAAGSGAPRCPPVRREFAGSLRWANSRSQRRPVATPPSSSFGAAGQQYGVLSSPISPMPTSDSSLAPLMAPSGGETTSYHLMKPILPQDANNPKIVSRIAQFLEHYGKSTAMVRKFIEKSPDFGIVHHAQLDLPVPAMFGKRLAHGCASAGGMAHVLCMLHAQQIIDTLRIPLFPASPSAQVKHREFALQHFLPIVPPMPGEALADGATPSPPPLKCIDGDLTPPPVPECPPAFIHVGANEFLWKRYHRLVIEFMERREDYVLRRALASGVLPRSGDPVEDAAQEAADRIGSVRNATEHVRDVCLERGFELPDKFWWETVRLPKRSSAALTSTLFAKSPSLVTGGTVSSPSSGSASRSDSQAAVPENSDQILVFYSKQQVWGTPYRAQGCGSSHGEAVNRAALHYSAIVLHLCPHPTVILARTSLRGTTVDSSQTASGARSAVAMGGFMVESEKRHLVELFFATQSPFVPITVTHRAAASAGAENASFPFVAILTFSDDAGLRSSEKGKSNVSFEDATSKAFAALHDKLLNQKRKFAALTHAFKSNIGLTKGYAWTAVAASCSMRWWLDAARLLERHGSHYNTAVGQLPLPVRTGTSPTTATALSLLLRICGASASSDGFSLSLDDNRWLLQLRLSGLVAPQDTTAVSGSASTYSSDPPGSRPIYTPLGQWIASCASKLSNDSVTLHKSSSRKAETPQDLIKGDASTLLLVASLLVHGALLEHFDAALTIAAAWIVARSRPVEDADSAIDVVQLAASFSRPAKQQHKSEGQAAPTSEEENLLSRVSSVKSGLVHTLLNTHDASDKSTPTSKNESGHRKPENDDSFALLFEEAFGRIAVQSIWPRYAVELRKSSPGTAATSQSSHAAMADEALFRALGSLITALGAVPAAMLLLAPRPNATKGDASAQSPASTLTFSSSVVSANAHARTQIERRLVTDYTVDTAPSSLAPLDTSKAKSVAHPASLKSSSGALHAAVGPRPPLDPGSATSGHLRAESPHCAVVTPILPSSRFFATAAASVKVVDDGELEMLVGEDSLLYFSPRGRSVGGSDRDGPSSISTVQRLHRIFRSHLESGKVVSREVLHLVLRV